MEPCRRSLAGRDSLTLILTRDRDMWVLVPANPVTATHTVIRLACSTYKGHGGLKELAKYTGTAVGTEALGAVGHAQRRLARGGR